MRNRFFVLSVVVFLLFSFAGCYTIQYTDSGQEIKESQRVLYVIGLVPLGNNNFKAGKSYKSEMSVVDWLIQAVTFNILHARTVTPM